MLAKTEKYVNAKETWAQHGESSTNKPHEKKEETIAKYRDANEADTKMTEGGDDLILQRITDLNPQLKVCKLHSAHNTLGINISEIEC